MTHIPGKTYFTLETVWQTITPDQEHDVLGFWETNGLSAEQLNLKERLPQVVLIARDLTRAVIGVCTAYKSFVKFLNNYVYIYRTMVANESRYLGVGMELLVTSRDFFNQRFKDAVDTECIGIMFTLENQKIASAFKEAVWPRTGFVFVGYNQKGQQTRIFYFDGARI